MAVSNQSTPIGGHLGPWNTTTSAVETLAGAGGTVMQVGELLAQKVVQNTEVRAMWFQSTEQTWFLVAGHFRNSKRKPPSSEHSAQHAMERIATSTSVDSLGGQISFAASGNNLAEINWKTAKLKAVRARIAAAPNVRERQKRHLATQQQQQEKTHYAQEGKVVVEEAEKIEKRPTGIRKALNPYELAMSRLTIKEEAKRKEAQQKQPVVAKGRSAQGPGNVASRQHADKSAGFAGAAGE